MATDPQFRVQDDRFETGANAPEAPKKKSALATCLTGCLIAFVVMFILAAIAGWWAMRNWRTWTSEFGSTVMKETLAETGLPPEETAEMNTQIDRLAKAFQTGEITAEQMGQFFENFTKSPLMTTILGSVLDKQYIERSGLSDEEKSEARVTIQRFMRGSVDDKIGKAERDKAMEPVMDTKADGSSELKKTLTDAELRQFLQNAQEAADAAGVPAEVEEVDPSDEFKRIVDETLGEGAAAAPETDGTPAAEDAPVEGAAPAEVEEPAAN